MAMRSAGLAGAARPALATRRITPRMLRTSSGSASTIIARHATMSAVIRCLVLADTYRDSVELMRVAASIEPLPGVRRAALMMATPANRDLLAAADLLTDDARSAGPGDLVIAVAGIDGDSIATALTQAERLLAPPAAPHVAASAAVPRTIADAMHVVEDANLAII